VSAENRPLKRNCISGMGYDRVYNIGGVKDWTGQSRNSAANQRLTTYTRARLTKSGVRVSVGSSTDLAAPKSDFRFTPESRHPEVGL
jgi:hypothetical protein